jgi:asparagine synthase (glutamine-hydrolysing)
MCGIAGLVKLDPHETVDDARLKRMRDVLRHRGPDGEGLLVDGPVGLGHRRLAIVDPVHGQQPMANGDGTVWITFNGEIYNHPQVAASLKAQGRRYVTRSDTETILHLYDLEGDGCVERLRGMFAFGLWDRARQRFLLARDPLGIKPLYYAVTNGELLFGSEIKAVLAAGIRPALNEAVLPELLATGFVSGEGTLFRGVKKLLPGRTLSWTAAEGLQIHEYWRPPVGAVPPAPRRFLDAACELRERLAEVVRSHLMSDVPLGMFLSGGIDSSGIAALMAGMIPDPIRTFSVGFNEPGADELPYAHLAARSIGAEHREVVVSTDEFFAALPRLIWHEDEPLAFPSSIPLYFVSRLAAEHVKVVLTGEGSDELFLGYNRYRVTAWNALLSGPYRALMPRPLRDLISRRARALPRPFDRYAQRSFLTLAPGIRALHYENFGVFSEALLERLLTDPGLVAGHDPYATTLAHYSAGGQALLERLSYADLRTYLVELCMKQDQMSMAASVESRVPFLDRQFVEHAATIPSAYKLRGWRTKAVLKEALRGLVPPAILHRPKMGFPVPVGRWFRGSFRPLVERVLTGPVAVRRGLFAPAAIRALIHEHVRGDADHGMRLWLLVNLEIWQRIFLDGVEPAEATRPSLDGQ